MAEAQNKATKLDLFEIKFRLVNEIQKLHLNNMRTKVAFQWNGIEIISLL
jgi:hypothetical protein